ncbi:hypothetical protein HDU93_004566 [Gonapodya sp. JEL0774]|nr:hypothetical protein HDU93_004566 [Gonapodya sp. JEL0774]
MAVLLRRPYYRFLSQSAIIRVLLALGASLPRVVAQNVTVRYQKADLATTEPWIISKEAFVNEEVKTIVERKAQELSVARRDANDFYYFYRVFSDVDTDQALDDALSKNKSQLLLAPNEFNMVPMRFDQQATIE